MPLATGAINPSLQGVVFVFFLNWIKAQQRGRRSAAPCGQNFSRACPAMPTRNVRSTPAMATAFMPKVMPPFMRGSAR